MRKSIRDQSKRPGDFQNGNPNGINMGSIWDYGINAGSIRDQEGINKRINKRSIKELIRDQ